MIIDMKKILKSIKFRAYSLPEVLLAMTIIGIIAVLFLPASIRGVQNREYLTGVKKAHTLVAESFDSMKLEHAYINKEYNKSDS